MAPIRNPTRNIQNLLILNFFFACSDFGVKNGKKKKVKISCYLYQSLDPTTHALIKNFPDLPRAFWRFEAKPLKTPHPFIWFKSLAKYSYPDFSKDENWKKKLQKQ